MSADDLQMHGVSVDEVEMQIAEVQERIRQLMQEPSAAEVAARLPSLSSDRMQAQSL